MKSKVFTIAWELFKANVFSTFADALRAAWKKVKLNRVLRTGVAYFTFTKADGTRRAAIGTLSATNFTYKAKSSNRPTAAHLIRFWDLEKRAFRCCKIQNLISID